MSTSRIGPQNGMIAAAADLSDYQFYAVKLGSSGWALPTVQGERVNGILQDTPESGDVCFVQTGDACPAKLGGTVTRGDALTVNSAGKLIAASPGEYVLARANESGVDGDVRQVEITHEGPLAGMILSYHIDLARIADGDVLTTFTPGIKGKILKFSAAVTTAVSTGSKASTLNLEIGTTNVTGGSLALTSANCTPLGAVVNASAITAANTFGVTDSISIEAASTTAFSEGSVNLLIVIGFDT